MSVMASVGADVRKVVVNAVERQAPEKAIAARGATLTQDVAALSGHTPKNVMITYVSTGNGHRAAAEAVYGQMKAMYPDWQIAKPVDMASLSKLSGFLTGVFNKVVAWGLWPAAYKIADRTSAAGHFGWLRQKLDLLGSGKFLDAVRTQKPDVIVHTNFFGSEIQSAARAEGKIAPRIENVQVVTDNVGYGMYIGAHADVTLAPNLEVAHELEQKGMKASEIQITGIPINPEFAKPIDRTAARAALGLGKNAKVLLAQGNLIDDPSYYETLMQRLSATYPKGVQGQPIEVAVVCGKNQALYQQLQAMAARYPGMVRLEPMGFMAPSEMHNAMAAADLSITKPGGLTTAESAASRLPMVLLDVMKGGQETYNAAFFERNGAGVTTHTLDEAIQQTVNLVGQPQRLTAMRQAAGRVAQPDAAARVGAAIANLP